MKSFKWLGLLVIALSGMALAQPVGQKISISSSSGNEARNVSGIIEGDSVEIEGIVIINGDVSIDGVKISRGTKKYRSIKSGKTYVIEWGRDNNVSVVEQ